VQFGVVESGPECDVYTDEPDQYISIGSVRVLIDEILKSA